MRQERILSRSNWYRRVRRALPLGLPEVENVKTSLDLRWARTVELLRELFLTTSDLPRFE